MARRTGALALIALLALVWAGQRGDVLLEPLSVSAAEELSNPGRAALNYQTGPLQQVEPSATPLPPPPLPSPIIVVPTQPQSAPPTIRVPVPATTPRTAPPGPLPPRNAVT